MLSKHLQKCISAHNNISHSPEKRGQSICEAYSQELKEDLSRIAAAGKDHERYARQYEAFFLSWIASKSRCISSFITGAARFPVARAEKYNRWEQSGYERFRNWREKALRAILRGEKKTVEEEYEMATARLEKAEIMHEKMKAVNAFLRKNPECAASELADAVGFSIETAQKILSPVPGYEKGFQHFELTNSRARCKQYEQRVLALRRKVDKGGAKEESIVNGVRVVKDYADDRLRLFFDGKPPFDIIKELKGNAFLWSPKNQAWQRKLTGNAEYAARAVLAKVEEAYNKKAA